MQEMVEIGRKNAELYPKVMAWCRHVEVKMTSAGLLAEAHNLPIGFSRIDCEHAPAGGHESMHLDFLARSFIIENCRGCPFHEPVGVDAIGYQIIREWEERDAERQAHADKVDEARARLYDLVSGNLEEALRSEEITTRSILQLIRLLDEETHHAEAAKQLVRASEIAAELFTTLAVEVICSHFPDSVHGRDCVAVVRSLGVRNGEIPEVAFDAAKHCLFQRHNTDEVCALIGDYVAQQDVMPEMVVVEGIVRSRENSSPFDRGHRAGPGRDHALTEIGKRDLDLLVVILTDLLSQDHKETRIAAARTIRSLIDEFPGLGLALTDSLIDSLELDDDDYSASADRVACQTLAAIYVRHPEEAEQKLEEGYRRASLEAKAILFDVYEYIASGRGRERDEAREDLDPLYERSTSRIVPLLLGIIGSSEHSIEAREAAAQSLDPIRRGRADALVPHLDTLFGTLANLTMEQVGLLEEGEAEEVSEALDRYTRQTQHSIVVQKVAECLQAVADLRPRAVLSRLREIVPRLDSKQPYSERYKSKLTYLYGQLGTRREFTPEVVPDLYKLLMDFDSNLIRGAAVNAVGEVLQAWPEDVPHEMLEVLHLYLSDMYVYIHKSAARAIRYVEPKSAEEATMIALRLLVLDKAHEEDSSFRRDLLLSLIHVARGYEELLDTLIVPALMRYARSSYTYLAEDALEWFERLLPDLPEERAALFAREVVAYLGRTERERYNDETFSGRYQILMALHDLPKVSVEKNLALIQETGRTLARHDAYDALRLVHLLSRFEMHLEAMRLAVEVAGALPKTKRNEYVVSQASLSSALEGAEVYLELGDEDTALGLLEDAVLLEEMGEEDLAGESRGAESTFEVAQRIIDRLREL